MTTPPPMSPASAKADKPTFVLVLSGGNALGAFQAGVYQALHEHGLIPDWVIGASAGAINGALIAGTPPEARIDKLREFWRPDATDSGNALWPFGGEDALRTAAVSWTLLAGRPGVFGPLLSAKSPWGAEPAAVTPAIFETTQLGQTLDRLVDFELLNTGPCRYTATAVDLESGDDVVFDTTERRVVTSHIRASAALPVTFPAVEVDGRALVDGGLSANLPLDPFFHAPAAGPTLCLAVDLLHLHAPLPRTLGETASRMQDLVFAAQSRRTIEKWQALDAASTAPDRPSIALVRLAYTAQEKEVAGKAMDFSGHSIRQRWDAGYAKAQQVLAMLDQGTLGLGDPGLSVHQL